MPTEHSEIDPSIEDPEVARLMNEVFVSIKVDREERPDIDNIYMGVCQMMTGSGGWPLTIIMTPDKKPFLAATYIPKEKRFGRMGMLELYEVTFEVRYLQTALELNRDLIGHFWDNDNGGFYFTAADSEKLLVRQKEIYDGAIPSGNSVTVTKSQKNTKKTTLFAYPVRRSLP